MIKGILIAIGITIGLLLPPIIHLVSGPAGPFIGGYVGVGSWKNRPESALATGLIFGGGMGLLLGLVAMAVLIILGPATDVISGGIWALVMGGVLGGTIYIATLGAVGAAVSSHRARSDAPE